MFIGPMRHPDPEKVESLLTLHCIIQGSAGAEAWTEITSEGDPEAILESIEGLHE